jgi:hypothetical protein
MSTGAHFSANCVSFCGVCELYEGVRCDYMELAIRRLLPKAIGSVRKRKERKVPSEDSDTIVLLQRNLQVSSKY